MGEDLRYHTKLSTTLCSTIQDTMDTHAADVHLLGYLVGGQALSSQLVDHIPINADFTTMIDVDPSGFGLDDTLGLSLPYDVTLELGEGTHHLKLKGSEGVILTRIKGKALSPEGDCDTLTIKSADDVLKVPQVAGETVDRVYDYKVPVPSVFDHGR